MPVVEYPGSRATYSIQRSLTCPLAVRLEQRPLEIEAVVGYTCVPWEVQISLWYDD